MTTTEVDTTFKGDTRNNQDIINYFWQKFGVEKVPKCVRDNGDCMYSPQTLEQIGCAIGCLLSSEDQDTLDDASDKYVSGSVCVMGIKDHFKHIYDRYFDESQDLFLGRLQPIHDDIGFPSPKSLEERVFELAADFNLTDPTTTAETTR